MPCPYSRMHYIKAEKSEYFWYNRKGKREKSHQPKITNLTQRVKLIMPKWKVTTEFTFDSAHYIKDYNGPCGRLHGHTYRVQIEAISEQLHSSEFCPHPVMVADFRSLKWAKKDVTKGGLDHCVLNEVMPPEYETTAEMIAKYIYDETKKRIPSDIQLKVRVSETPNSWAAYED
ncbi:MAG: 6-pyruvoyl trahydropterin synthase family protein [Microcoleaceae cyanobacterium]